MKYYLNKHTNRNFRVEKVMALYKQANELKKGNYFVPDDGNEPMRVLENKHSKSGKHGSAKSRVICVGLFSNKKKEFSYKADQRLVVPEILKKSGQLIDLDTHNKTVSVMDTETYETVTVEYPPEIDEYKVVHDKLNEVAGKSDIWAETKIEFWEVMNKMIVTRVAMPN